VTDILVGCILAMLLLESEKVQRFVRQWKQRVKRWGLWPQ
jgi:hypothetical protein